MSRSSSSLAAIDATADLLPELKCGSERGAGDFGEAAGACFEVGFQLLRDGGVGELIDVGGIDAVLVVGQAAQDQRQHRADRQCEQQVLGF